MSYETADILDAAADVIERDGWCQRTGISADGRRCAINAIARGAEKVNFDFYPAMESFAASVGSETVHGWNDAPERTEQEVLDALRLAAKKERIAADFADGAA